MKTIRKLIGWLLLILIGIFIGINYEYWLDDSPEWVQEIIVPFETTENITSSPIPEKIVDDEGDYFNYQNIENRIIEQVNALRQELEIEPVVVNDTLRQGAYIRAEEIEESFSHTRPNGRDPFTVFNNGELDYHYRLIGENLAMATYFGSDESMAQFIFQGWVDSPDHYETMINPEFEEIGVGVHYDGDILYATQFFGVER